MDSPFQPTIYPNSKQSSEDIDRTAKLLAPSFRIMGSGPCTYFFSAGKTKSPCTCRQGVFTLQPGATDQGNENCQECTHSLSLHEDFSPALDMSQSHSLNPAGLLNQPKEQLLLTNNPHICPRTDTVQKIAQILTDKGVVHVRGTPSSGKTTLAGLLKEYYIKRREHVVFLTGWYNVGDPMNYLIDQCVASGYGRIEHWQFLQAEVVFIIDEAQQSYHDWNFWIQIIKTQSGNEFGPKFCLFTSYGSPSTGPTEYLVRTTPLRFGPSQRISIIASPFAENGGVCLFYSREEFEDVVSRKCSKPASMFVLDHDAREYLYSITNGHPGATNALLTFTYMTYRSQLNHHTIKHVTKDLLIQALDNESKVFGMLREYPVYRSFPLANKLTVKAADVLRNVLLEGSIPRDLKNEGIRLCYEEGWVHSEATDPDAQSIVCILPSKLHEKFIEYHLGLRDPLPFPFEKFPSLSDLCEAVLRKFSRTSLLLSRDGRLGAAARVRLPEAQFQDEWYRAFNSLLGHGIGISSEWSNSQNGRIDFKIVGPAWGVELLRDGDRLAEHCNRFLEDGTYHRWIANGQIKDWIILDCRHSRPQKYEARDAKLWRVVFESNYSSAYVLDCDNQVIIPEFPLMN